MTGTKRSDVVSFWDEHVRIWLDGGDDTMRDPLPRWFESFKGTGRGEVTQEGFVEPFQGDLAGTSDTPRVVILGLNPGRYDSAFQSRNGRFAQDIRRLGSYSRWVNTYPYVSEAWETCHGRNVYYSSRLAFTRRWLQAPNAYYDQLLMFELYPWHSTAVTGPIRPPSDIVDTFVWQPISELDVEHVFAFGRDWEGVGQRLGLPLVAALGRGGEPYGSSVPSRAVRIYELPSKQNLVVLWHSGSAGPPRKDEVEALRAGLGNLTT